MLAKKSTNALFILFLPAFSLSLSAQSWQRDSLYGTNGIGWADASGAADQFNAQLLLPNGKMLVTYSAGSPSKSTLSLLTADGLPDAAFGFTGKISQPNVVWSALAAQPDGEILAGGSLSYQINIPYSGIWRYLPDGTPDSTFGEAGMVKDVFASFPFQWITNMIALPDGHILVSGIAQENPNEQNFRIARLNADGSLDQSFGQSGFAGFAFTFDTYRFTHLAVQPDGKILAGCNWQSLGHRNIALFRYRTDGTLDTGFGTGGKADTDFNFGDDYLTDILVYPDGKILASGGYSNKSTLRDVPAMVRYLPNGKPDLGFGQYGEVTLLDASLNSSFRAVRLMPDGYLLTVVTKSGSGSNVLSFLVKRYMPNGQADGSANSNTSVDDNWDVHLNGSGNFAWTPDNQLLYVSFPYAGNTTDKDIAVARYNFTGSLSGLPGHPASSDLDIGLSPNPGRAGVALNAHSQTPVRGTVTITSATGKLVLSRPVEIDAGGQTQILFSEAANWPGGIYFWRFAPKHGLPVSGQWIHLNQ